MDYPIAVMDEQLVELESTNCRAVRTVAPVATPARVHARRHVARKSGQSTRPASAARSEKPSEPETVVCRKCGERIWKVIGPNGKDLRLDRFQIETLVRTTGFVRRTPLSKRPLMVQRLVRGIGGFTLCEPVWFRGLKETREAAGWQWFASAMSLSDAEALSAVIYSNHNLTCEGASDHALKSSATNVALEGDAAGDRQAKRKLPSTAEMQESGKRLLKSAIEHLDRQQRSVAQPAAKAPPAQLPVVAASAMSAVVTVPLVGVSAPSRPRQLTLWFATNA